MSRRLFSDDKLERIYNAAVKVLEQMGMRVHNRQCLEALEKFGARLHYPAQCAFFPPEVVNRCWKLSRQTIPDGSDKVQTPIDG